VTDPEAGLALGYADAAYARALGDFGRPVALPASGGWLLERPIPGAADLDAMGPYPLFACRDWSALGQDLDALRSRLLSVTLVADPFGDYDESLLRDVFERVKPFKNHFVTDMAEPVDSIVSPHHRYYAHRALKRVQIEVSRSPQAYADEWTRLYSGLVERHEICGLRRFSAASFVRQLQVPGVVLFRAIREGIAVGAQLWYEAGTDAAQSGAAQAAAEESCAAGGSRRDGVAYSHLAASSEAGYDIRVSYALYLAAVEYFRSRVRWLDLGAGAGVGDRQDGLTAFKRGWATGTRPVYLCSSVLWPERYELLAGAGSAVDDGYFPAYRAGEFAGKDAA
jgi:hypothetical protein